MNQAAALAASPYGTLPPASSPALRKPVSLPRLQEMRARGEKITMLTAYDATFAAVADAAGVECILVGDSLGMVCQGLSSTVGVSLETMRYHVECVTRGVRRVQGTAWIIGDLPYGTYHESKEQALRSAAVLMQEGAHMVKLEGGGWTTETVRFLVERGIPVCAHLGLTPQRVHALGGFRVQGRDDAGAAALRADAKAMAAAGAAMLVLELVPSALARQVTEENLGLLTIGIGAGAGPRGQVLVLHDLLGLTAGKRPRFVRDFTHVAGSDVGLGIREAVQTYVQDVKQGRFPDEAVHGF